jgi:DNA-binding IclR family transcriptional regulator
MNADQGKRIRATERALAIIEALQELDRATVTEIAEWTELPKTTVYNHLDTLRTKDYVIKENKEYRTGLRFLTVGGKVRAQMDLYQVTKPEVKKLAGETGELANLIVEEGGWGVYLYRESGGQAVHLDSYVGKRQRLHGTAFGKAILAFMPDGRVDEIIDCHGLAARTEKTITNRAELKNELEVIRDRGYAYDDGEGHEGLRCVAAPIMTQENVVLGGVSVSGPVSRIDGERFRKEIPDLVLSAANVIEINLTYT